VNVADIIALAEAAAKLVSIVAENVERGRETMKESDLARLQKILDPLHEENKALAARLDEALRKA